MGRFCAYLILSLFFIPVSSAQNWRGVTPSGVYDFRLIEGFEEGNPWYFSHEKAVADFAKNAPADYTKDSQLMGVASLKEFFVIDRDYIQRSAVTFKHPLPVDGETAKELFIHFMHPGKESQIYRPAHNIKVNGIPRAVVIYLKGNEKLHTVSLLFSAPGTRVLELPISDLNFRGWRRFEVALPVYFQKRNIKNRKLFEIIFHGVKIKSHFREPAGLCQFAIDNVIILTDRSQEKLPGAEIKDRWQ